MKNQRIHQCQSSNDLGAFVARTDCSMRTADLHQGLASTSKRMQLHRESI